MSFLAAEEVHEKHPASRSIVESFETLLKDKYSHISQAIDYLKRMNQEAGATAFKDDKDVLDLMQTIYRNAILPMASADSRGVTFKDKMDRMYGIYSKLQDGYKAADNSAKLAALKATEWKDKSAAKDAWKNALPVLVKQFVKSGFWKHWVAKQMPAGEAVIEAPSADIMDKLKILYESWKELSRARETIKSGKEGLKQVEWIGFKTDGEFHAPFHVKKVRLTPTYKDGKAVFELPKSQKDSVNLIDQILKRDAIHAIKMIREDRDTRKFARYIVWALDTKTPPEFSTWYEDKYDDENGNLWNDFGSIYKKHLEENHLGIKTTEEYLDMAEKAGLKDAAYDEYQNMMNIDDFYGILKPKAYHQRHDIDIASGGYSGNYPHSLVPYEGYAPHRALISGDPETILSVLAVAIMFVIGFVICCMLWFCCAIGGYFVVSTNKAKQKKVKKEDYDIESRSMCNEMN